MNRRRILGLFAVMAIQAGSFVNYADWYAEKTATDGKYYVLLTADWCVPCQSVKAELKSKILSKGIDVVILDVDVEPEAAKKINPSGMIPQLVEFTRKDGKWTARKWDRKQSLEEFCGVRK